MTKNLKTCVAWCAALTFALAATSAEAAFHLYRIQQIFSNADGTVQFITLSTDTDGEYHWAGQYILTSGSNGVGRYDFPTDLPLHKTSGTTVLVATQGFANLHLITPDYIVPNNFISTGAGSVNFAEVQTVSYGAGELPTDGVHALLTGGYVVTNTAVNLAGQTASVGGAPASPNYQGLWWKADEPGWGVNFVHQGDRIFATWYTYDTAGNAYWLSMLADRLPAGNAYKGDIYADVGPAFNNFVGSGTPTKVGDGTVTFTDANNGSFFYEVTAGGATNIQQTKPITRFSLGGAQPACTYSANPNLAGATNYQDLWWVPTESGWGVNFAHQGNQLYATWYTYDAKTAGGNAPLWLSALLSLQTGSTNVYLGPIYRTSGPRFDNYVAPPATQTVGFMNVTFTDGNHATFLYSIPPGVAGLPEVPTQTKSITRFLFAAPAGTVCQ